LFQNIFELKKCKETKAEKNWKKKSEQKKETEQTGPARGNQPRKPPQFPLSLSD
jgi:hypothetical protein